MAEVKKDVEVGDMIRCKDKDDCVKTMVALQEVGAVTDFCYEYKGNRGLWLYVSEIEK